MNAILTILNILGYIATMVVLVTAVLAIFAWFKGLLPAILRLGNGLAKRKISIFAKSDNLSSLINLLVDSGLFLKSNVTEITKEKDFGKSESSTLLLVYWPDWKNKMIQIRNLKKDNEALVIYAPKSTGNIPENIMAKLDEKRNVTVVNFRGRLLNDMVTAMITTGYMKK
jgi:hypothetical protein